MVPENNVPSKNGFIFDEPKSKAVKIKKPSASYSCLSEIFADRFRYFILILGCLCLTSICSNLISLNFTFICMVKKTSADTDALLLTQSNATIALDSPMPEYYYNQHEKSMLIWAIAISSLIATFPFTILYSKFGARYILFSARLISAFSTLLIPSAVEMGLKWFLVLRVFQGISYAGVFAAIGVLCSRWASLKQNGIFISVLTCFSSIAASLTNPIAGVLCESRFGWPAVYYSHGTVSLFLFALWFCVYSDHPSKHQKVSPMELEKIHRNKSEAHINMDSYVPYIHGQAGGFWRIVLRYVACSATILGYILTNPIVLIIWLNALFDIGAYVFLTTYMPTYINNVLHYSVGNTGILGALPTLFHIPPKLLTGYLSDNLKGYNERTKMIVFNTLALFFPGCMYAIVGFVPDEYPMAAIILFILIGIFGGANCGGFYKCGCFVSRQYSGFVISNIQFIKCLTLFLAPAMASIFISDDSNKSQWTIVFVFFGVGIILSNALFCYVATDEPANFTHLSKQNTTIEPKNHFTNVPDFPAENV